MSNKNPYREKSQYHAGFARMQKGSYTASEIAAVLKDAGAKKTGPQAGAGVLLSSRKDSYGNWSGHGWLAYSEKVKTPKDEEQKWKLRYHDPVQKKQVFNRETKKVELIVVGEKGAKTVKSPKTTVKKTVKKAVKKTVAAKNSIAPKAVAAVKTPKAVEASAPIVQVPAPASTVVAPKVETPAPAVVETPAAPAAPAVATIEPKPEATARG